MTEARQGGFVRLEALYAGSCGKGQKLERIGKGKGFTNELIGN